MNKNDKKAFLWKNDKIELGRAHLLLLQSSPQLKGEQQMKTSVFLIEDDPDFGRALLQLLQSSPLLEVVGMATTLAAARAHLLRSENEVYLVDITLPDGSGIEMMREIRTLYPSAKILALSTLGDERHIFSSITAGASGYMLKSEMPANILQVIVNLVNEGAYLSGHASKMLINKFMRMQAAGSAMPAEGSGTTWRIETSAESRAGLLTPKELEILNKAQQGSPAKVIAAFLGISIFTVNQHLRSIYRKLNVRNKMEAVQSARRQGLL